MEEMKQPAARPGDEETVRLMIRHENEVIAQRMTWLITLHGLLFAALSFAWKDAKPLVSVLCFVGVSVSVFSTMNVIAATRAQYRLSDWWEQNKPPDYKGPDVIGLRIGARLRRRIGPLQYLTPQDYLSIILAIVWIIVFFMGR